MKKYKEISGNIDFNRRKIYIVFTKLHKEKMKQSISDIQIKSTVFI